MYALDIRILEDELMDQPGIDEGVHIAALKGIGRVNRISGIEGLLWRALLDFRTPNDSEPLRVLDVACGGGDVTLRLAQRAQREGIPILFSGSDKSQTAVEYAQRQADALKLSNVRFFCQDALQDPFQSTSDVVMSSLFLHHLNGQDSVLLLRRMAAAATRGVLLDDLRRSRLGYFLAWCGVRLLTRSAMVHVDGPMSVKAAYRVEEVRNLATVAGLDQVSIETHWPQRFLLKWERPVEESKLEKCSEPQLLGGF